MIYNFYTYLFVTAIAAGAALAVLIRTLIHRESRKIWDISSVSFLVLLILTAISFSAALFFLEPEKSDTYESLIFFIIFLILFVLIFYFLRKYGLLVILILIAGTAFGYSYYLSEYVPFSTENTFNIYVLQDQGDSLSLEITDFNNKTQFVTVIGENPYPVFTVVNFPGYLFFLQSSSYIKYEKILVDDDNLKEVINNNFNNSETSKLPFINSLEYEPVLIDREILSAYRVDLQHHGELRFKVGK